MANAQIVNIYPKGRHWLASVLAHLLFWGFLVGSVGFSRVWFGGAWVIDLAALVLVFIGSFQLGFAMSGRTVDLDRDQAIEWVREGAPKDVAAWKASRS